MRAATPFVASVLVLAGCVQLSPASLDDVADGLGPVLAAGDVAVRGVEALVWEGKRLEGNSRRVDGRVECGESNCDRFPFRVDVPDGYWDANPGFVEVSIEWEHQEGDYSTLDLSWDAAPGDHNVPGAHYLGYPMLFMDLTVLDAEGNEVARGAPAFHFASVALVESLPPGDYEALVHARYGKGAYTGVVQVEPKVVHEGELLPDLVMLPPSELIIAHPIGREAPYPMAGSGVNGCDPNEMAEERRTRCLRFASSFGNLGPGRLEMHLPDDQVAASYMEDGRWVQWVFSADGSHREVEASPAMFHRTHGHHHIGGLDVSTLYAYDLESGARGEAVGDGRKTGFCPADSALIDPTGLGTVAPIIYDGCCGAWGQCPLFTDEAEIQIILSPGWYDVYPWWRADQYVDVAGAADGVYELETCANPDGFMVESRLDNDCASVLLRLTGDSVENLGVPGSAAP